MNSVIIEFSASWLYVHLLYTAQKHDIIALNFQNRLGIKVTIADRNKGHINLNYVL